MKYELPAEVQADAEFWILFLQQSVALATITGDKPHELMAMLTMFSAQKHKMDAQLLNQHTMERVIEMTEE